MPRILRLYSFNGPVGLKIDQVPYVKPGANEVRISIEAFALNYGD